MWHEQSGAERRPQHKEKFWRRVVDVIDGLQSVMWAAWLKKKVCKGGMREKVGWIWQGQIIEGLLVVWAEQYEIHMGKDRKVLHIFELCRDMMQVVFR